MAETVKKAKAPAKPKAETKPKAVAKSKTSTTKKTVAEKIVSTSPSREEIASLAQRYWAERGWQDGHAEQDWLRAEQELSKAS